MIAVVLVVMILIGASMVWYAYRDGGEEGLDEVDSFIDLTEAQESFLEDHGFVVVDGDNLGYDSFQKAYEYLNEEHVPIVVTTDCMLHQYHVFFDNTMKMIEEEELYPLSLNMSNGLYYEAMSKSADITDPWLKSLSERVGAFFAVGVHLAGGGPSLQMKQGVNELVQAELSLIEAHGGFAVSPIFADLNSTTEPHREDYSQYVPRGHYTRSETLKVYFKEMMWYGRQTFYNRSLEETAMAVLATLSLRDASHNGTEAWDAWERIYGVSEAFVGESDDLMPTEYLPVIEEVFGDGGVNYSAVADHGLLEEFRDRVGQMRSPSILSTFMRVEQDIGETTKGLRIMGQRWIPDSYMFQNLVTPKVQFRWFPTGIEVPAILGCQRAEELLEPVEQEYPQYGQELDNLSREFADLPQEEWESNLYMGWMDTLTTLHDDFSDPDYPDFMRDPAWRTQKINTHMGSWTELRHDTILYAKQSYTPAEGVSPGKAPDERGYVEPIKGFYPRLTELVEDTKARLEGLSVLSDERVSEFDGLLSLLDRLDAMVDLELTGNGLGEEDFDWLRGFHRRLSDITGSVEFEDQKTLLVADVHTDSNTLQVLEEGVGYVDFLIVKVKGNSGRTRYCTGPVFSYYEFKQPMSDRLTDEDWTDMLEAGDAPSRPEWTKEYMR
jgi:hypothetical protein